MDTSPDWFKKLQDSFAKLELRLVEQTKRLEELSTQLESDRKRFDDWERRISAAEGHVSATPTRAQMDEMLQEIRRKADSERAMLNFLETAFGQLKRGSKSSLPGQGASPNPNVEYPPRSRPTTQN